MPCGSERRSALGRGPRLRACDSTTRACALRVRAAEQKPKELLERDVRTLVASGLPAEAALDGADARRGGVPGCRAPLGQVDVGYDATLRALARRSAQRARTPAWRGPSSTASRASSRRRRRRRRAARVRRRESIRPGRGSSSSRSRAKASRTPTLALEMEKDGDLKGTLAVDNPMGGARLRDRASRDTSRATSSRSSARLAFGEFKIETTLTATDRW